jgi:hypothetical protein
LPIVRFTNNEGTSGDSPSSTLQGTDSRQENRALPTRAVIASLDDFRC